jgi:hypothetical protein
MVKKARDRAPSRERQVVEKLEEAGRWGKIKSTFAIGKKMKLKTILTN